LRLWAEASNATLRKVQGILYERRIALTLEVIATIHRQGHSCDEAGLFREHE
jgi:hypothetical protein